MSSARLALSFAIVFAVQVVRAEAPLRARLPDGIDVSTIQPSAARPADFDDFWAKAIEELQRVPIDARLEPVKVEKPGVRYFKTTFNNVRGKSIRGQLARPLEGERFPALLIVQWAGVYALDQAWVLDRAAEGWLVLNIEAHDLPIDEPPEFYKAQFDGALKDYWAIGNEDRETSYFLPMYLSCYRAADYLSQREDWDRKTLVVMGGSQGGMQALVTAGLHPRITASLAVVPAGCDMLGPTVGRKGGWPQWYEKTSGKDPAKVHAASRYFDVVNFASRINCPVLVGIGLSDDVCPPEGILAAMNQIKSPKEVILMPNAEHQEKEGSHAPYQKRCWDVWLPALRAGKAAPVNQPE